jgi:hypothetical protein
MTFAGMTEGMIPFPRKRVIGREDEASIWTGVATWSALTSIDEPRDGDLVDVTDADGSGTPARAVYVTGDAEWQVAEAYAVALSTLTALVALRPVRTGAIFRAGATDDDTARAYRWDGAALSRMPDGRAWVWTASTLAGLPGTSDGVLDGDRATLTGGSITGTASRTSGAWLWATAVAASYAGLPTTGISTGAVGYDGTYWYLWSGTAFVRVQSVRPLSSISDITDADPDDQYGTLGGQLYRLHAFASGSTFDAVARRRWLRASIPKVASLFLRAWGVGTEADATLGNQGYAITEATGGTVDAVSGYSRLSGGGGSAILAGNFTLGTTQRCCMVAEARCDTAAAVGRGIQLADGTSGSRVYVIGAAAMQLYDVTGAAPTVRVSLRDSPVGLPTLAQSPALLELIDDVATVELCIAGVSQSTWRRNIAAAAFNRVAWIALAGTILGVRNHYIVTWTP